MSSASWASRPASFRPSTACTTTTARSTTWRTSTTSPLVMRAASSRSLTMRVRCCAWRCSVARPRDRRVARRIAVLQRRRRVRERRERISHLVREHREEAILRDVRLLRRLAHRVRSGLAIAASRPPTCASHRARRRSRRRRACARRRRERAVRLASVARRDPASAPHAPRGRRASAATRQRPAARSPRSRRGTSPVPTSARPASASGIDTTSVQPLAGDVLYATVDWRAVERPTMRAAPSALSAVGRQRRWCRVASDARRQRPRAGTCASTAPLRSRRSSVASPVASAGQARTTRPGRGPHRARRPARRCAGPAPRRTRNAAPIRCGERTRASRRACVDRRPEVAPRPGVASTPTRPRARARARGHRWRQPGHRHAGSSRSQALQPLRRRLRSSDREVGRALQQRAVGRDLVVGRDAQRLRLPEELPLAFLLLQLPRAHRRNRDEQCDGHEDREDEDDEVRADSMRNQAAIVTIARSARRETARTRRRSRAARSRRRACARRCRASRAATSRRDERRREHARRAPAGAGSFTVIRHSVRGCVGIDQRRRVQQRRVVPDHDVADAVLRS